MMKKIRSNMVLILFCSTILTGCLFGSCGDWNCSKQKSYQTKDGSVFYNRKQVVWYENLSQNDKNLYHKNMKICDDYLKTEDYKKEYKKREKEAENNASVVTALKYSIHLECLQKLNTPDYYGRW